MTDSTNALADCLMPREPTREMWAAGANAAVGKTSVHHDIVVEAVYRAMFDTALRRPIEPVEAVAWRWRGLGAGCWIYDPSPEWREEHKDEIELQPLYASPPTLQAETMRQALEPLAKISLWRDVYPDGPDMLSDQRLQGYFTPEQVRAARAALSTSPAPAEDGQ